MREQKNIKININSCKRDKQKDTNQLQNQPKKKKRDFNEIK